MAVEVWVRNPDLCIKECIEVGMTNIVWDRGYLVKKGIDPTKFANVYFPPSMSYRMLVIGDSGQGAVEIHRGTTLDRPTRVHPLWEYGEDWSKLEDAVAAVGPGGMVVVTRTPVASTGLGRRFFNQLRELQSEHPDVKIHVHGLYSYRIMFGYEFGSVDIEPRMTAKKGKVYLPNGQEVTYEQAMVLPHWMAAVGANPADLKIPRERCMYNIKSALWAAEYFTVNHKFETRHKEPDDDGLPIPANNRVQVRNVKAKVGDKFLCDLCSLRTTCKYFRIGSVCSVPDSEASELAKFFKTRDSDQIIEGLGSLLAIQVERLEEGRQYEIDDEKIDKNVTVLVNSIFDRATKLAKLVNPALAAASAPRVKVSLTQNNASITAANPAALMAAVVNELESRGVPRSEITPEMVKELISVPEERRIEIIDATVVEKSA